MPERRPGAIRAALLFLGRYVNGTTATPVSTHKSLQWSSILLPPANFQRLIQYVWLTTDLAATSTAAQAARIWERP